MTSNKETIMGKKKKGKGYGSIVLTIVFILIFALSGIAMAEQEWLPGYGDKNGTLGKDTQSWRIGYINTLVLEGPTSDGNETFLSASDPSGTNKLLLPDESGTLLSTGGLTGVIPLSDAKIFIGNSAGLGIEQSISGDSSITNAGVMTNDKVDNTAVDFGTATDGFLQIATDVGGGTWDAVEMTGEGSITNAGVFTLDAGAVSTVNSVTLAVAAGTLFNTVEVETGSVLIGWSTGVEGVLANTSVFVNTINYTDPDFRVSYSDEQADLGFSTIIGTFLRP